MKKRLKSLILQVENSLNIEAIMRWVLLKLPRFKHKKEAIVFLRTDNIGDYILFRNFLPFIRQSEKYQNKKIILIGNKAWRGLAEHFDKDFIDNFIWIDGFRYLNNKWYKFFCLLKCAFLNPHELVNTVHSRTILVNQLVHDLTAFGQIENKISSIGDTANLQNLVDKQNSDALFDVLLPSLANTDFEFFRNKIFIECLINEKIELDKPYFNNAKKEIRPNQILIFPSAQSPPRRWQPKHFATLIGLLSDRFPDFYFLILGHKNDFHLGENIISDLSKNLTVKNLCGETSLVELVKNITESRLLISNETSAVHIAAAVDTPTICVSNGNHFGRFNPYPPSISNHILTIYPNKTFEEAANFKALSHLFDVQSNLDIQEISPHLVFEKIINLIENN